MWTGEVVKNLLFVDVINRWPLVSSDSNISHLQELEAAANTAENTRSSHSSTYASLMITGIWPWNFNAVCRHWKFYWCSWVSFFMQYVALRSAASCDSNLRHILAVTRNPNWHILSDWPPLQKILRAPLFGVHAVLWSYTVWCSYCSVFIPFCVHSVLCAHFSVCIQFSVQTVWFSHWTVFIPLCFHNVQCSYLYVFILFYVHTVRCSYYLVFLLFGVQCSYRSVFSTVLTDSTIKNPSNRHQT